MTITINEHEGTETITTTEHSLTTDTAGPDVDTDDGVYEIVLDLSAIASQADLFEMKLYEKVLAAGSQMVIERWTFSEQADPGVRIYLGTLGHGWDVTLVKLAGTDRSISWGIRKVA